MVFKFPCLLEKMPRLSNNGLYFDLSFVKLTCALFGSCGIGAFVRNRVRSLLRVPGYGKEAASCSRILTHTSILEDGAYGRV